MDLNDLLDGLMTDMRKVSNTASLIGQPLKIGNVHVVPLLGVAIGFGTAATDLSGSGERKGGRVDGAGAGGTMMVTPRAFVVVGEDGSPHLIALKDGKYAALQPAMDLSGKAIADPPKADTGPEALAMAGGSKP